MLRCILRAGYGTDPFLFFTFSLLFFTFLYFSFLFFAFVTLNEAPFRGARMTGVAVSTPMSGHSWAPDRPISPPRKRGALSKHGS